MSVSKPHRYATQAAIDGARQRGFDPSYVDWRDAFVALTDTMSADGERSCNGEVTAGYVGPMRDGVERWTVHCHGRAFDVAYNPGRITFDRVMDTRKEST